MKKQVILLFSSLLMVSCVKNVEISVFNNSEVDRSQEMVELCLCQLEEFDPARIVLFNEKNQQIPCQILYKGTEEPKALIFPVSLKAGVQAVFTVKEGQPLKIPAKTNVRLVSERKDDMSWENDRIGFRMFGPGSRYEYLSNGVDVWLKRTNALVLEKWYRDDLSGKASYHQDHGEGLDCYGVGQNKLGAGGICPISQDSFYTSPYFDRYKILDNGPLRSSFVLYYDAIRYGSKKISAEMMVTLDAGSNLNQAVVVYKGDTSQIKLAVGISLHDTIQSLRANPTQGFIGYAENATYSIDYVKKPAGRCYTGVVFNDALPLIKTVKGHCVGLFNYKPGQELRYYFGAGWSKHGFKNDADWFRYLSEKRLGLMQPLKVKITK